MNKVMDKGFENTKAGWCKKKDCTYNGILWDFGPNDLLKELMLRRRYKIQLKITGKKSS